MQGQTRAHPPKSTPAETLAVTLVPVETSLSSVSLVEALVELRERLEACRLELPVAGVERARFVRRELIGQIDDYLLPRVRRLDAPLLAVVGGSTGAGKSTLVNSIVGAHVSAAGVLRPTTRSPILVCRPDALGWFEDDRILPGLARTSGMAGGDQGTLHLVPNDRVPAGMALLDAPDIDSVVRANRELAGQLLAAADLWLFVTTAARYADAVPWDLLRTAKKRSTALAVVLNRVPPEAATEVPRHLAGMLEDEGLSGVPVFTIPEASLQDGLIPQGALAPLDSWLGGLAADADARAGVVRRTLEGALDSLTERVEQVADQVDAQVSSAGSLRSDVDRAYAQAGRDIEEALRGGSLLRGEVLARWQDFVGTGQWMRTLESRIGLLRDRIRETLSGRPAPDTEVRAALESSIETVVLGAADRAAERVVDSWGTTPGGTHALAIGDRSIRRSSPALRDAVEAEVRGWQGHVLELVAAEGASKRVAGRVLSFGVNSAGVALMVAVFAHTGGLTGGELVVAGGTATLSQKLLEAVFGDQAVRMLTSQARSDLLARVDRLLAGEAQRYYGILEPLTPEQQDAGVLREAARAVQSSRT